MLETSNSKKYNYIISNYNQYNLGLKDKNDMLILLNKLEAYNETLDSLHDCNGFMDGYCDLVVTSQDGFYTDEHIANAVNETNAFFESKEKYLEFTEVDNQEDLQFLSTLWDELVECGSIVKTTDGYVELAIV